MSGAARLSVEDARRIRTAIIGVVVIANFIAATVMFCLLNLLFERADDDLADSLVSFVVVSVVAFPGAAAVGTRLFRPVERWVASGQLPTARVRAIVVGGPRLVAAIAFAFWIATAAIIGTLELTDGGPAIEAVRTGGALLAAGVTSAALSFLLVERRARPLVASALGGEPPVRSMSVGLRPRLLLSWAVGSGVPLLAIVVGELSIGEGDPRLSPAAAVFLASVGLVVGGLVTAATVRSVAEPIGAVREALAAIERGELSVHVVVDDAGEVGRLQAGVNRMAAGLRERQRLADLFGRHVGAEVAERALRDGIGLGGERRHASALFVDLRDSTALAAGAPPEEVVDVLNRFFSTVVRAVTAEGGWVNKFEGDGAMCIFGVPASQPDHAARALRAGRALDSQLRQSKLRAAIGISSGEVVAGNVGAEERYEYTVIGDPVNEAARLTDAAKETASSVLAAERTVHDAGPEGVNWEVAAELQLRGRPRATTAFRPVSELARPEPT